MCPYCGVGCQITYHLENERIVRVDGRDGISNASRLCVKGRFRYDYIHHPGWLTRPLVRKPGVPKDPARMSGVDWREIFREAGW